MLHQATSRAIVGTVGNVRIYPDWTSVSLFINKFDASRGVELPSMSLSISVFGDAAKEVNKMLNKGDCLVVNDFSISVTPDKNDANRTYTNITVNSPFQFTIVPKEGNVSMATRRKNTKGNTADANDVSGTYNNTQPAAPASPPAGSGAPSYANGYLDDDLPF